MNFFKCLCHIIVTSQKVRVTLKNRLCNYYRHSREGGNPVILQIFWIPVFKGMTFDTETY